MSSVSFMRLMDAQEKRRVIIQSNPSYAAKAPKDPASVKRKFWEDAPNIVPRKYAIVKKPYERDWLIIEPTEDGETIRLPNYAWKRIMHEVAEKHRVTVGEIKSSNRAQHLVRARYEVFYRLRTETDMSLPAIGRRCGGRDHTTVLHGIRKYMSTHGEPMEPSDKFLHKKRVEFREARADEIDREIEHLLLRGMNMSQITREISVSRLRVRNIKKRMMK